MSDLTRPAPAHRTTSIWPYVVMVLVCVPLVARGFLSTHDASWSDDPDTLRDVAQAQRFLDGHPLADSHYRGEYLWYPPLVPWIAAVASRVTGVPLPALYPRMGVYLNGLAVLAFGLLVARLFGPWVAVLAVVDSLYLRDPFLPPWASFGFLTAPYAGPATMTLFCASLSAYDSALARPSRWRYALVGVLSGLTLLGHAAPAAILVLTIAGMSLARRAYAQLAGAMSVGLLVGLPLLYSVVWHYQMTVHNRAPMLWDHSYAGALDWQTCLAITAFLWLLYQGRRDPHHQLALWWSTVAALLFLVGTLAVHLGHPLGVPRHHFLYYAKAAQSAILAWALVALASRARNAAGSRVPFALARYASLAVVTVALATAYALTRPHLRSQRGAEQPVPTGTHPLREGAYNWLRAHTTLNDVVLAGDESGFSLVAPGGASVVAIAETHSNPYVDWEARARSRDMMMDALQEGPARRFKRLAAESGVSYVVRTRVDGPWPQAADMALEPVYENAGVRIYRVSAAATGRR
jgi:hypothetical protein